MSGMCVSAPFPGVVAASARVAGASFVCCRPSRHSFSGWVLVVFFSSGAAASRFAAFGSRALPGCFFSSGEARVLVRRYA